MYPKAIVQTMKQFIASADKLLADEDVVSHKRKRILVSNDFRNAFKRKHIYDVFQEINQANWCLKSTAKKSLP